MLQNEEMLSTVYEHSEEEGLEIFTLLHPPLVASQCSIPSIERDRILLLAHNMQVSEQRLLSKIEHLYLLEKRYESSVKYVKHVKIKGDAFIQLYTPTISLNRSTWDENSTDLDKESDSESLAEQWNRLSVCISAAERDAIVQKNNYLAVKAFMECIECYTQQGRMHWKRSVTEMLTDASSCFEKAVEHEETIFHVRKDLERKFRSLQEKVDQVTYEQHTLSARKEGNVKSLETLRTTSMACQARLQEEKVAELRMHALKKTEEETAWKRLQTIDAATLAHMYRLSNETADTDEIYQKEMLENETKMHLLQEQVVQEELSRQCSILQHMTACATVTGLYASMHEMITTITTQETKRVDIFWKMNEDISEKVVENMLEKKKMLEATIVNEWDLKENANILRLSQNTRQYADVLGHIEIYQKFFSEATQMKEVFSMSILML